MTTAKTKTWPELHDDLVQVAIAMAKWADKSMSARFLEAGESGIRELCADLSGHPLYLPMVVTPELAELFLSMQTEHQRTANALTSDSYEQDIKDGNWMETGEALRFDTLGNMVDGGHRGKAIKRAGVAIRSLVVFGIEPDAALLIDSGRVRTHANMLAFHGVQYYSELGGLIPRLIAAEDSRFVQPHRSRKITRQEIVTYVKAHPDLVDIMKESKSKASGTVRIPRVSPVQLAFAWTLLSRLPARYQPEVHNFIEDITTGANLPEGSSALVLRNELQKGAPPQFRRGPRTAERGGWTFEEATAMIFTAWNRRAETAVRKIKIPSPLTDNNFPVPHPRGHIRSRED